MHALREVKKAQRGSRRAFEGLILSHQAILYRVARSMLHREEDCADAIQEAILRAYQNLHSLKEPKYFRTWLLRIVMNECKQIHRRRHRLVALEAWTEPVAEDDAYQRIEVEQLLEALPEDQSELLKLYHIEDISIQDLAELYEVPEGTIKTRLRRAREKAKEIWSMEEERSWRSGNKQFGRR